MKKFFAIALVLALLVGVLAACGKDEGASGKHHVEIDIRDYGTVAVELDADSAPITVANFLKLSKGGFYDGLTFHRIINGFMMQGGDPEGTGMGGSSEKIKGEFSSNGQRKLPILYRPSGFYFPRRAVCLLRLCYGRDGRCGCDLRNRSGGGQQRHCAGRTAAGHGNGSRNRLNRN